MIFQYTKKSLFFYKLISKLNTFEILKLLFMILEKKKMIIFVKIFHKSNFN